MRVAVVVPELEGAGGGSFTLVGELLAALPAEQGGHTFEVLHYGSRTALIPERLPAVQLSPVPHPVEGTLDRALGERGLDLVWFLTPETEQVGVPFLATVWDLEHRNHPYFPEISVSGWSWEEREFHYRSTLPKASYVLIGSEEGRRQVHQFFGVALDRIAVVPLPTPGFPPPPAEPASSALAKLALERPYLLYPAQFWPHKNHVTILRAMALLVGSDALDLDAVFTGADKGNLAHVRSSAAELGLASRVRNPGLVDRATLAELYRGALALVFPSFFGPDNLPPLEAFALGCPVIAAKVAGADEQLGDAALLFPPGDEQALAAAVRRLLDEPALRGELVARGRRRAEARTAAGYIEAVVALLDALEPIRRCWSREAPFEHL